MSSLGVYSSFKWKHDFIYYLASAKMPDRFAGELLDFTCQWLLPTSETQMP